MKVTTYLKKCNNLVKNKLIKKNSNMRFTFNLSVFYDFVTKEILN